MDLRANGFLTTVCNRTIEREEHRVDKFKELEDDTQHGVLFKLEQIRRDTGGSALYDGADDL